MAKKTIQIKNRYTEEIIFECEAESIKEAVEIAIMKKANLRKADLRKADLRKANLRKADLREANLRKADLREADLRKANLREADLWKANLSEANLSEANLSEADLNCIFYNTKVNLSQRKYITEDTDLFKIVEESSSNLKENKVEKKDE